MTRIRFEKVSIKGRKVWKDADGKRHQKTREFCQTINPFNLLDGRPKTHEEIMAEIKTECDAWEASPNPE